MSCLPQKKTRFKNSASQQTFGPSYFEGALSIGDVICFSDL
jgi:hypothetical protein